MPNESKGEFFPTLNRQAFLTMTQYAEEKIKMFETFAWQTPKAKSRETERKYLQLHTTDKGQSP